MSEPAGSPGAAPGPEELRSHGLRLLTRCTEKLAKIAHDPEPNMSLSAVQALGKIGSPATTADLFQLLGTERIAEEAVLALARVQDPQIGPRMVAALKTAVPSLMASICGSLWHYGDAGALQALEGHSGSNFKPVRRAVMDSLGKLGGSGATACLLKGLDDPEEEVVLAALLGLGRIPKEQRAGLVPVLAERWDHTVNPKARATLVQVLMGVEGEDVLALMKKALKDDNARVRANAVEVVAAIEMPEKRKLGILKPLMVEGQNNRVMGNLAIAFGTIDPKAAMQILSQLLNSTEKWERASAVYAARHIQSDRIAGWLTTIFTTEPDADVLRNVIESLSYFSGDEVTSCFVKALTHSNPLVRSGAVKSLGRLHDPSVESYLLKLLEREEDRNVICETLTALGRISEPARIPVISRYLQHTDLRVQANAIEALMHIGTVEIIPHIEPFLNSSDNRVKANAAVALWNSGNLLVADDLEGMLDGPNIKQRSSAIYAVGEIGESLRDLENLQRYLLLVSALQENLQLLHREEAPVAVPPPETKPQTLPAKRDDGPDKQLPVDVLEQAMTLLGQGKPEAALTALIEFNSHEESWNPYVEYLRADLHRRRGELEPSIKGFEEVTRRAEPFVHTYLHLANLHNRTQEISRSLEAYFNAYSTQLSVLGEVVGLGRQLLAEDKVNEASLLLKDLVSQMAINPKAHRATGLEFLRYRRYEEAFRHLARAYLSEPNSAELVFSLAVACFKTQRFEAARILCQKLEAHFPTEPVAQKKAQELLKLMEKTVPPKG